MTVTPGVEITRGEGSGTRDMGRHGDGEKGEHAWEANEPRGGGHITASHRTRRTPGEEDPPEGTEHHHIKAQAPRDDNPTDTCPAYQARRPTQAIRNTDPASNIHHTKRRPPATNQPNNPSPQRAPAAHTAKPPA